MKYFSGANSDYNGLPCLNTSSPSHRDPFPSLRLACRRTLPAAQPNLQFGWIHESFKSVATLRQETSQSSNLRSASVFILRGDKGVGRGDRKNENPPTPLKMIHEWADFHFFSSAHKIRCHLDGVFSEAERRKK